MLRVGVGGILGLDALLTAHWRAIEADFQRHYHLDLASECYGPDASVRRLVSLVFGLVHVEGSAMAAAIDPGAVWTLTDHLLASVAEQSIYLARMFHGVHFKGEFSPPVITRPGVSEPEPVVLSPAQLAERMGARRHG